MSADLPGPAAVAAAAARIAGHVVATPLLRQPLLDRPLAGGGVARAWVKAEVLQHTGSFKVRGAFNRLLQLDGRQRAAGVVAFSSGNHAQAVAYAARVLGIDAVIVMPDDAPQVKLDGTRRHGATIRLYDRGRESREQIAAAIAARDGRVLVPSYDDVGVIAGQGTLGLEVVDALAARDLRPDLLLCPVGGGGLLAGTALAVRGQAPACALVGIEPAGFDDHVRSRAAGVRCRNAPGARSCCDALLADAPGELTWPIHVAAGVDYRRVSDADVLDAMRWAFTHLKLVVEPGGAVALAAWRTSSADPPAAAAGDATVVIVLSGGNVDAAQFAACLED